MKIKTLAEILAESDTDSASTANDNAKNPKKKVESYATSRISKPSKHSYKDASKKYSKTNKRSNNAVKEDSLNEEFAYNIESIDSPSSTISKPSKTKAKKHKKTFHPAGKFIPEPNDVPAYQPPAAQSIKQILAEVKANVHSDESNNDTENIIEANLEQSDKLSAPKLDNDYEIGNQADNLPAALKAYLRTPEQRQAEIDAVKAESRLRWLAFYYLSRREYGKAELKQKLLDKEQEADKIDALLDEFEEKGYQSDYRTTLMLIRENIRKGRGRGRIKQEFYTKKMAMPDNIDELIDMANAESDEFSEFIDESADNMVEGVDWLKLAVSARTKKYGNDIPTDQKDKARQLRFLQYRGFNSDICFAALNYTLDTLDERF